MEKFQFQVCLQYQLQMQLPWNNFKQGDFRWTLANWCHFMRLKLFTHILYRQLVYIHFTCEYRSDTLVISFTSVWYTDLSTTVQFHIERQMHVTALKMVHTALTSINIWQGVGVSILLNKQWLKLISGQAPSIPLLIVFTYMLSSDIYIWLSSCKLFYNQSAISIYQGYIA